MVAGVDGPAELGDVFGHRHDFLVATLRVGRVADRTAAEEPDGLPDQAARLRRTSVAASLSQWNMYAALPITKASYPARLLTDPAGRASASRPQTSASRRCVRRYPVWPRDDSRRRRGHALRGLLRRGGVDGRLGDPTFTRQWRTRPAILLGLLRGTPAALARASLLPAKPSEREAAAKPGSPRSVRPQASPKAGRREAAAG